jgi:hypothetical protein
MAALLLLVLAASTASDAPAPAPEKKVCRFETRMGTLSGRQRVCHTESEWRDIRARARQTYQDIQGAQGSTHSLEPLGQMNPPQ